MYYTYSSNTVQTREENVYFSKPTQNTGSCKNKAQEALLLLFLFIHNTCSLSGRLYNSGITEECDIDWMEVKSELKK